LVSPALLHKFLQGQDTHQLLMWMENTMVLVDKMQLEEEEKYPQSPVGVNSKSLVAVHSKEWR